MSVPLRAPARAGPGAPTRYPRWNRLVAITASTAAGLGLVLGLGSAASAASAPAVASATAQTYFVAPDGTDTTGSCAVNTASNAFPTIQDALACAVNGDSISLAPTGSTPYPGFGTVSQNITISAQAGATARTVKVNETTAALTVDAGATVKVTGVTLNGASNDGAPDVTNHGVLTLTRDTVTGSPAVGGIENSSAGASAASLALNATTVSGNEGTNPGAGITSTTGTGTGPVSLTAENSTIAGNTGVSSQAGGVAIGVGTTATFVDSTVTGNQGGGGAAGGLFTGASAGSVVLSNTIIGGNTGGTNLDCAGPLADGPGGHNLIGNIGTGTGTGACSGLTNGVNGDQVSVPAGLLPLADNGGPTHTAALAPTSPAIGAGNPTTCEQAPIGGKDQRGHKRKATTRDSCDIGAYDTAGKPVTVHTYFAAPNGTDTTGSCAANTAGNAFPTIQDALACATDGDAISLAATGSTPYPGFGEVSHSVAISAASGATARTVAVNETTAALTAGAGAAVKVTGVTLDGGSNTSAADVTNHGVLTLTRDTVTGSPAAGGIVNEASNGTAAELVLNATTVSGNQGTEPGAGITSTTGTGTGPVSLTAGNSTIAGNTGVTSQAGGVAVGTGTTAAFVNSTITANQGGSAADGLLTNASAGSVVLSNTVIGGNTGGANPDCLGALADGPGGHNLIGDTGTGCTGLTNGVNGDQLNVSPDLQPLASNGGPTNTAALASGSPAIGAGNATTCVQAPISDKDQRGHSRNATTRGGCDIGAYDTGGAS